MKIGLCQMKVTADKQENLRHAAALLQEAAEKGAEIAILPEMFCCPYDNACFPLYGEERGGETWQFLSRTAKTLGIYLIGGSMPEWDERKLYNTSYSFSPEGKELARHRKVHLFDINVPGGQYFKESDVFTAGDSITVLDTEWGRIGVAICFDIRFSELFRLMEQEGAKAIFVPAAFNMTTGPAHWSLAFRSRALDNQCFVIGCSLARDESASYVAYGHSIVTDPWGEVVTELDEKEGVFVTDIDLAKCETFRARLPILSGRRTDLYRTEYLH